MVLSKQLRLRQTCLNGSAFSTIKLHPLKLLLEISHLLVYTVLADLPRCVVPRLHTNDRDIEFHFVRLGAEERVELVKDIELANSVPLLACH